MRKFLKAALLITITTLLISFIFINFTPNKKSEIPIFTGDGAVVLCYHRVLPKGAISSVTYETLKKYSNDAELIHYSVSGDNFEKQIKYLKDNNIKVLSLEDLDNYFASDSPLPNKSIIITFDDIDESVYKNAFPILKKYNTPFSAFAITGQVGNKNFKGLELASWEQIKEMQNSGLLTLGLHSHNMHFLDKTNNAPFLNLKNINDFYNDTQQAIKTFKDETGTSPKFYSYPYGFGTPKTDDYLLKNGMKFIFSLKAGVITSKDPRFFIKRVLIDENNWDYVQKWIERK